MHPYAWPYQDSPLPGYWGKINSHFNFCEEDYMVTSYAAELVNTVTSLVYVVWGLYGIYQNRGYPDVFSRNLPNAGAICVGVGSVLFHISMKNYTQWCDDLSMLLATGIILYRVFTFDKSRETAFKIGSAITLALTAFSIWHCYVDETNMHSILFGIMMIAIALKTRSIINTRVTNPVVQRDVAKLNIWGVVIFVIGFIFWNLDFVWCNRLNAMRRAIGMPWSFLLEFHGWWHIFTGLGAYIMFVASAHLCSEIANEPLQGRYIWPIDTLLGSYEEAEKAIRTKSD